MSNDLKDFEVDEFKYRIALAGAYRKPPPQVGVPALVLHYGLWEPDCSQHEWHNAIDHFLYALFLVLKTDPSFDAKTVSPNYDYNNDTLYLFRSFVPDFSARTAPDSRHLVPLHEKTRDKNNAQSRSLRYEMVSVRTEFRDLSLLIRAELYSEFWNLDFICDFDKIDPACLNEEFSSVRPYFEDFKTIVAITCTQFENHFKRDRVERISPDDQDKLRTVRQTLHKRFRDLVRNAFLTDCFEVGSRCTFEICSRAKLGTEFTEFHGAILGLQPVTSKKQKQPGVPHDPIALCPIPMANTPPGTTRTIHSQVGHYSFRGDSAVRVVDALWPLIKEIQRTSENDQKAEEKYGKPEYTVSLLQNGRSIYVSSLGWLDPQLDSSETKPIIYTIITSYQSPWALGRLVERIHNMGSFRLAAIRDIEKVIHVGDELNKIEMALHKERDTLPDGTRREFSFEDTNRFADRCLQVGSAIARGLMYRVGRSAYYVSEFERNLRHLRCKRIEGFQPYNQFVERRMYGTFDYIRRVGERYRELRLEIDLILRKNYTAELNKNTEQIEDIQALGEFALFAGLLPYYVGTMAFHVLGYDEQHPLPVASWRLIWIAFGVLAIIRLRKYIIGRCLRALVCLKTLVVKHVLN